MTISRRLKKLEEAGNPNSLTFNIFFKDQNGVIRDKEGRICKKSGNAVVLNEGIRQGFFPEKKEEEL